MTLERDIELLRAVPFFEGIPAEPLKLLAFSAEARDLADKTVLFSLGDDADGGMIVIDGRIDLVDDRTAPAVVKERLGPGALIGELALIVETRRPVTAIAVGRARVLVVRRSLFRRMLSEYPEITQRLRDHIAERLATLSPEIGRIAASLAPAEGES